MDDPEHHSIDPHHEHVEPSHSWRSAWGTEVWAKMAASFVFGVLSAAFIIGGKSRDLTDLMAWRVEANSRFDYIGNKIDKMDREGTARSHWKDDDQEREIDINRQRLVDMEKKLEPITTMQAKISRLEDDLKDIKNGNRK